MVAFSISAVGEADNVPTSLTVNRSLYKYPSICGLNKYMEPLNANIIRNGANIIPA
ncbi:hypothetical protein D3C81_2053880 [compost metagenome]